MKGERERKRERERERGGGERERVERGTFWIHVLTEACERSSVSKMRFIDGDICIISPLIRHSFLLSSSTVFMDSIHSVSTGPSNTTHLRSSFCAEANSLCRREEKKKVNTCTLRHLSLSSLPKSIGYYSISPFV